MTHTKPIPYITWGYRHHMTLHRQTSNYWRPIKCPSQASGRYTLPNRNLQFKTTGSKLNLAYPCLGAYFATVKVRGLQNCPTRAVDQGPEVTSSDTQTRVLSTSTETKHKTSYDSHPQSPPTRTPGNQPTTALNRTGWKESLEVSGTLASA
jgi:hypothetical protein